MLITSNGYCQRSKKISGTVRDSLTQEPIRFATVILLNQQTKVPVKGTNTDTSGHFVLENLDGSMFTLRITYIGYKDIFKENILINPATGELNFGALDMTASKSGLLKEVAVTAKKEALRNVNGKKIFLVNQSLVSKGGSATDLLRNVPTLQVDVAGRVSLRGSVNIKVLIDGKPTIIANGDITQILQSIPASAIESIEVIPNPPSNYDADGEGIINIILKKNSRPGLNGSLAVGGGTLDNYNADASLNYQKGKVNLYGNYSFKDGKTLETGFQNVTYLHPSDSIIYVNETFPAVTRNEIQFIKGGIDYSLTPRSTLGVSASFNSSREHENQVIPVNEYSAADALLESFARYIAVNNNGNSYELDLDYSRRFKKPKEELLLNFAYASGSFRDYEQFTTQYNPINGVQSSKIDTPLINDTRHHSINYNIQADYILPVGKSGQFSAGYRSQITLGKNDQYAYCVLHNEQVPLYAFTDFFTSNNQVNAVYLNFKGQSGKLTYQAGVRGEDSRLHATITSYNAANVLFSAPVIVPVKGIYPSLQLTEKLKDSSQLQFTFSRRLSKPSVRQLNSTTDFSDPSNYNKGNPELRPESVTNFELDYSKTWHNISVIFGIYINIINNAIQIIETSPVNNETTTIPENLNHSLTAGLEMIGHVDLLKGWSLTANANVFNRDNAAAPQFGIIANHGISWNANITSNVTPLKRVSFQIHADYSAPNLFLQFQNRSNFGMDAAAKFDFAGNRASLSFNATDIFNSRRRAFLSSSEDVLLNFQRHLESSRATLIFSYRFGTNSGASKRAKQEKRIEDAS
ncbi:MAG: TonB-dependent receptor [Bacteroidetes bacterium]|nr:TonB-dependent receptor [Bacteroidota bacterium]